LLPATVVGGGLLVCHDMLVDALLDDTTYGAFHVAKRITQLAGVAGMLGLQAVLIRETATGSDAKRAAAFRLATTWSLAATTGLAVLLVAGAPSIASWFEASAAAEARMAIVALSMALPMSALRMALTSAAKGGLDVRPTAVAQLLVWPIANVAGVALLYALGLSFAGVLAVWVGSAVVATLVAAFQLAWAHPWTRVRGGHVSRREVAGAAFPLWIAASLLWALAWMDHLILARLGGLQAAAEYAPVLMIAPLLGVGLAALNGVFAPLAAVKLQAGQTEDLQRLYRSAARWGVVLCAPGVAICLASPAWLLELWPSAPVEAGNALRAVAFGKLVWVAVGGTNYLLIMAGRPWAVVINMVPGILLDVCLCAALVPVLGTSAAGLGNGAGATLASLISLAQVRHVVGIHPVSAAGLRTLFGLALLTGWVVLLDDWLLGGLNPWPRITLGCVVVLVPWMGAAVLLGASREDGDLVQALRERLHRPR
jgi:O-antigen/teichoic acid export membrane protein